MEPKVFELPVETTGDRMVGAEVARAQRLRREPPATTPKHQNGGNMTSPGLNVGNLAVPIANWSNMDRRRRR